MAWMEAIAGQTAMLCRVFCGTKELNRSGKDCNRWLLIGEIIDFKQPPRCLHWQ